jgi:hypothetical protein
LAAVSDDPLEWNIQAVRGQLLDLGSAIRQPSARERIEPPYKERKRIEYHDGPPIIDPAGEEEIFRAIAEHRAAVVHCERCVEIEQAAEGEVSADEYAHLERNTKNAFDETMLWARAIIVGRSTTRRGLTHQARYLAAQFDDPIGCSHLPDDVGQPRRISKKSPSQCVNCDT